MSAPTGKGRASALTALVREAKRELSPTITDDAFASMEARILARMADEPRPFVDAVRSAHGDTRGRVMRIGALVLAAAAAVAIVAKNDPGGALLDRGPSTDAELTAGSLRATEGDGEVRVGGMAASAGHVLRAGDVVEAEGARALLERPRKVTWLLEAQAEPASRVARVQVKSAGESLVLALEDGAVEAQVTPVASGEAFAVDVAAGTRVVRVAVHGTHLRVSRAGSRVVVDLTEGVVSIGAPPRSGATYGTLVTAPSHVEFDAADLEHTLKIDHTPTSVRAAVALAHQESPVAARAPEPQTPSRDLPISVAAATRAEGVPASKVTRPVEPVRVDVAAGDRKGPTEVVAQVKAARPPRETIAAAVRACAAARSRPENVPLTVTSSLQLKIAASGEVETAHFAPPLVPEIQTCAAAEIYKAKLAESAGEVVTIPIDFSY
jgi:hypothetical protein